MREQVISRHWFRRTAREAERQVQAALDAREAPIGVGQFKSPEAPYPGDDLPAWARGVRVEKNRLGLRWKVVATENKGH